MSSALDLLRLKAAFYDDAADKYGYRGEDVGARPTTLKPPASRQGLKLAPKPAVPLDEEALSRVHGRRLDPKAVEAEMRAAGRLSP